MRIRKISPTTPPSGLLTITYGTSETDGYAQSYQNEHNVIVSSTQPTTSERVWVKFNKELFDKNNVVAGYLSDAGNVVSNTSYSSTNFINIAGAVKLTIAGNSGNNENVCFYNSSQTFISRVATGSNTSLTMDVPENTTYVRATVKNTNLDIYKMQVGTEIIAPSINVDNEEIYSTKNKTNCVKIWEGTAYQVNDTMLLSEPLEVGKMYVFKFLGNSSYYHNYDYFIYQNDAYSNTNTAQINYYSYPDTIGFRYRLSYQTSLQTLIINEASNGAANRAIKAIYKLN